MKNRNPRNLTARVACAVLLACMGLAAFAQEMGEKVPELLLINFTLDADPVRYEVGELFTNDMKQYLGVDIRHLPLQSEAKAPYYRSETDYAFSFSITGLAARPWTVDPDETLGRFHSRNIYDGGTNQWGYNDPKFDALVDAQNSELDPVKRRALVFDAQRVMYEDVGALNLYAIQIIGLYNKDLFTNFVPMYGTGAFNFWNAIELEPLTDQRILRVANVGEPGSLNVVQSSLGELEILQQVFDTLVRIRPDGSTVPWMVTDIQNPDNRTYLMTLRDDLRWHDGQRLTAEDVAFTFAYYKEKGQPRLNGPLEQVESVEAVDEHTVKFVLSEPSASFLTAVLGQSFILPQHIWQDVAEPLTASVIEHPELMVGSGPFKYEYWRLGEEIYVSAVPDYFAPAKIEGIRHIAYADNDAAFVAMRTQRADITSRPVLPDQAKEAESLPFLAISRPVDISARYMAFNFRRPPTSDVAFRRAVAHMIRYDYIVNTLLAGDGSNWNTGLITPGNTAWANTELEPFTFDPDRARAILTEAGYTWDQDGNLHLPAGMGN